MKQSCKCPPCQILALLAITLAAEGLIEDAEMVAQQITWLDDDATEGYTDTWTRPMRTEPEPDSVDLN